MHTGFFLATSVIRICFRRFSDVPSVLNVKNAYCWITLASVTATLHMEASLDPFCLQDLRRMQLSLFDVRLGYSLSDGAEMLPESCPFGTSF